MLTALITFLSSSAGGALVGFILDWADRKSAHETAVEERRLRGRLAELGALAEYSAQLDTATPGTLKEVQLKFQLWGLKYEIKKWKLFKTNVFSPRARMVAACLGMLAFSYCAVLLIFALEPSRGLWTFHPDPDPVVFDFLFVHLQWPRSSIFVLTTGGVAYIMAHPLVFILSTAIVGTARKLAR